MIHLVLWLALAIRTGMAQDLTLSFPNPSPTGGSAQPTMTIAPFPGQDLVSCGQMEITLGSNDLPGVASDDSIGLFIVTSPDQSRAITGHPSRRDNVTTSLGTARLADSFYNWDVVTVVPGWYSLNSHVNSGVYQGLEAWSAPFRITQGRDTSCLPTLPSSSTDGSSSSAPPPTGSPVSTAPPDQSSQPSLPPPASGHKSNAGTIAGPIVGALGVIALIALGAFLIRRRLAKKRLDEKTEDPFSDPAPRPSSGNWGVIGGAPSQPSPRLRNSFATVLDKKVDSSEAHNMTDIESQDTVPPLNRNSTSSIQMLTAQRSGPPTGPSTDTLPSSEGLPPILIPSGRTTPTLPRSAAGSDSGHSSNPSSGLARAPSTNSTPVRPSRKPVPAYIPPAADDDNVLPSHVDESFAKSLEETLIFTPSTTKTTSKTPITPVPAPAETAFAIPGQADRMYHYLMPDPPAPPRD